MKWNEALIYTTVFSYSTGIVLTGILGIPVLEGIALIYQAGIFFAFTALLLLAVDGGTSPITRSQAGAARYFLSVVYGVAATLSFIGVQKWINYYGTLSLGPFMTLWDLALAIALLTLEDN